MSNFTPEEIWVQIFQKSSPETLIRCLCVCKSWKSLISSPSFVSTHLTAQKPYLIVRQIESEKFLILRPETLACSNLCVGGHQLVSELRTIGTVNGVVCLASDVPGVSCTVALWNPKIRKYLDLPSPHHYFYPMPQRYFSTFGFGFDPAKKDYKIVRIIWESIPNGFRCSTWLPIKTAQIFCLREWAWRTVDLDFNLHCYYFKNHYSQCLSNGAAHWVAYLKGKQDVVLSFHFETEKLKVFDLPQELLLRKQVIYVHVCKLGPLLSVLDYKGSSGGDIWAMQEYGNDSSWCKMVSLDWEWSWISKVLWVREDGGEVVVLTEKEELVSYDSGNQNGRLLGVQCKGDGYFADEFVPSLVLLDYVMYRRRGRW